MILFDGPVDSHHDIRLAKSLGAVVLAYCGTLVASVAVLLLHTTLS